METTGSFNSDVQCLVWIRLILFWDEMRLVSVVRVSGSGRF